MRVYEIAREAGVTSAEVLKVAATAGVAAATAISSLEDGDADRLRAALQGVDGAAAAERRRQKLARAAELGATLRAGERERLAEHLRIAQAAAEGAVKPVLTPAAVPVTATTQSAPSEAPASSAPAPASAAPAAQPEAAPSSPAPAAAPAPAAPTRPTIRMAPGYKPKPLPSVSAAQTGLTAASGFKPLQHAKPAAATISISVAAVPKARPAKPAESYDDFDRGNRRGKKDREGQKSFDKRAPRVVVQQVPQAGGHISVNEESKEISIRGAVIVKDLAAKLNIKPNRLIADLMGLKILASINQRVESDVATKVAEKYGFKVTIEHARDKSAAKPVLKAIDADDLIPEDAPETLKPRAPVITFLGHVDHGKTTLMDWIRKEHVAAGEAGGITQQISAYQVEVAGKKITFLDTPGHAAFSAMRARGAQITDIAVLIVAADDGIMPQTEECIRVCRQTGVQIMVAITKADKPTANVDRVKQQLQKRGLTPEDWGGDIICCPVSGVTGLGVDSLLENILVQAEVLELQANPDRRANGFVIESELQQGLGPCATLLVTGGTLRVGDAILIGEHFGKVRALIDDHGRRIREAPPATPVKCTGLSGVPEAGSEFRVMLDEKRARTLAEQAAQEKKEQELSTSKAATLDALMSAMAAEGRRELNVIVKSDTQGSLEAIVQALQEIKSEKVGLNVIGTGTGNVSLTDVKSAAAGKAIVVGFDIGSDAGVQQQARHDGVRISSFRIIYELIDHVRNSMLDLLPPEYKEVVKGHAEIKAIYDIGKLGRIAGSQMLDGSLLAKEKFRILRDRAQIWDGKVQTLRHFKDEVKEVTGQQECGVCFAGFEGFQVGDTIECYTLEELPRSL
ncbi:MAG: translation initiation factor IF-2 [Kiritimatiellia bacterium]